MKLFYKLFFYSALSVLFYSCDNKLDLLDDYRETPVIYGLLNLSDSVQYIRVQKAFLGEGNAFVMAQNYDSIYYDTTDIALHLEESNNGVLSRNILLFPDLTHPKDAGVFVNYPHLVFRTDNLKLKKDLEYKLIFNNKKTGKTITAVTEVVDNVIRPFALSTPTINIVDNNPLDIKFPTIENGKVYGLHVLFYYKEKKLTDPDSSYQLKSLDYVFADIVASSTKASNQNLEFLLKGEDFFSFIGGRILPDNTLIRPVAGIKLDFIFTTGAEDFYIYYSVNQPSTSVNQTIPDFTNLSDGKGLFSSRNKNVFANIKLNPPSTDSLVLGIHTKGRFTY